MERKRGERPLRGASALLMRARLGGLVLLLGLVVPLVSFKCWMLNRYCSQLGRQEHELPSVIEECEDNVWT